MTNPQRPDQPLSRYVLQQIGFGGYEYRGNMREHPPAIGLYGPSGAGKTNEAAIAASRAVWVTSKPTVLRAYIDWCSRFPELVRELKLNVHEQDRPFEAGGMTVLHLPEKTPDGRIFDTLGALRALGQGFRSAIAAGFFPWIGVWYDEFDVLLDRVYLQCQHPEVFPWASRFLDKNLRFNPWGEVVLFMQEVIREMASFANDGHRLVGFCGAETPPRYLDKLDMKRGLSIGDLKAAGGPKTPHPDCSKQLVYDFDVVLRITLEEKAAPSGFNFGAGATPAAGTPTGTGPQLLSAPAGAAGQAAAAIVGAAQNVGMGTMSGFGSGGFTFGGTPMPSAAVPAAAVQPAAVINPLGAAAPAAAAGTPTKPDDEATAAVAGTTFTKHGVYLESVEAYSKSGLVRRIQVERTDDFDAKIRAFVPKGARKLGLFDLMEEAGYNMRPA